QLPQPQVLAAQVFGFGARVLSRVAHQRMIGSPGMSHHHDHFGSDPPPRASGASAAHPPLVAEGAGCLEILSDRLRESPGIVAIEANFGDSTLAVRYRPTVVAPEQLNALAEEIGAL